MSFKTKDNETDIQNHIDFFKELVVNFVTIRISILVVELVVE